MITRLPHQRAPGRCLWWKTMFHSLQLKSHRISPCHHQDHRPPGGVHTWRRQHALYAGRWVRGPPHGLCWHRYNLSCGDVAQKRNAVLPPHNQPYVRVSDCGVHVPTWVLCTYLPFPRGSTPPLPDSGSIIGLCWILVKGLT